MAEFGHQITRPRRDPSWFDRLAFGGGLIALWYLGAWTSGIQWTSSPSRVVVQIYDWARSGDLFYHSGYTMASAAMGFVIGAVPGGLLPLLLRRSPMILRVIDPFIVAGYGIPKVALIPLFIAWFGIGIWSKVALVVSVSFFLVFFSMLEGVRAIDTRLVRMAEIAGASETQIARSIVWPSTAPFVLAAINVSLPLSIGGAAVAELISSNRGIGYMIQSSAMNFDATGSLAGVVILALLVAATNLLTDRAQRRMFPWRR